VAPEIVSKAGPFSALPLFFPGFLLPSGEIHHEEKSYGLALARLLGPFWSLDDHVISARL
jgi:hypothetical protein